uniref:Uncharacterized protein n=1 Tax=Pipistrellus kuhlii TaxID=59472 RepID=A0A7J7YMX9_PIPKU|nr:hypothetical protein mPipKuh1_010166 [Pipistrellus kuhlii]
MHYTLNLFNVKANNCSVLENSTSVAFFYFFNSSLLLKVFHTSPFPPSNPPPAPSQPHVRHLASYSCVLGSAYRHTRSLIDSFSPTHPPRLPSEIPTLLHASTSLDPLHSSVCFVTYIPHMNEIM